MRRSNDFDAAVRRGRRAGRQTLVVHLTRTELDEPARVGFVVSRAVGSAVVRNRVKRRLRAVVSHRSDPLPLGGRLVVRALPGSADLDSSTLSRDFDRALAGASRRLDGRR
jgi:ribonuclease P protein component